MAFSLDLIRPGDGSATRYRLEDGTYLIGRGASCRLCLPYPEVSERHALLVLRGESASLEDLHSANGSYVNGIPVDGIVTIAPDAVVQIGETMLRVSPVAQDTLPAEDAAPSADEVPAAPSARTVPDSHNARSGASGRPDAAAIQAAAIRRQVKEQIQQELIARLDLKRLTVSGVDRAGISL